MAKFMIFGRGAGKTHRLLQENKKYEITEEPFWVVRDEHMKGFMTSDDVPESFGMPALLEKNVFVGRKRLPRKVRNSDRDIFIEDANVVLGRLLGVHPDRIVWITANAGNYNPRSQSADHISAEEKKETQNELG